MFARSQTSALRILFQEAFNLPVFRCETKYPGISFPESFPCAGLLALVFPLQYSVKTQQMIRSTFVIQA